MKISKRFKSLIPTGEIPSLFTNLSLPPVKLTRLESELETKMLNLDLKSCKLPDITRVIYLNAKTKRPKEAQMAFDYINELGLKPDLVAFNNLMAAYASGGNLERVQELMAELREKGLEPDMVTYSILINASVYKDVDLAFQYYQEYRKLGKPNQIILGTLIKGILII